MRIRCPGIGVGVARHQVRFAGGRRCPQPKSAIDMHPGIRCFRYRDDLERGVECPGIHIPGLQADDGGTGEVRKHVSTHAALLVHWDAHHPVTTKACQPQGLEQRGMGLLANDHRHWWSAKHAIGFHIPSCLLQDRMARCGQAGEIRHRRSSDEASSCFGRQTEHIAQPTESNLLQLRRKRCNLCQSSILIPGAGQPVRCQCCW